ncbi:MAG: BatD family protein [Planctomycetes bacterium]|nr:BatD family protein [Planctomycetota bacterium]
MHTCSRRFILCSLIWIFCNSLFTAEAIWTLPDHAVPGVKIRMALTVKNFGSIKEYIAPDVPGVTWDRSVQRAGTSTTINNGHMTRESRFVFHLTFNQEGNFTIPALTLVDTDGEKVSTQEIKIMVSNAQKISAEQCYASIEVKPQDVVAGEHFEIIYTVGMRAQKNFAIQSLGFAVPKGVLDIGDELRESKRNEYDDSGRLWTISSYHKKYVVSTPGTYIFDGQQTYGRIVRAAFTQRLQSLGTVAIKPFTLSVQKLPHKGQPASFQGLVGKVTIVSSLDRERISLGEGVQLNVQVAEGNIDMIHAVALPEMIGFAVYDGENIINEETGTRTFSWSLVPKKEGMYIIPEISIPYYDARDRRYKFAKSESIALSVIPGRKRELGMIGKHNNSQQTPTGLSDAGLILPAPLHGQGSRSLSSTHIWLGLLYGACAAAIISCLRFIKRGENVQQQQLQSLIKALKNNDIQQANQILHAVMPHLSTTTYDNARALQQAIETARFGGGNVSAKELALAQKLDLQK